MAIGREGSRRHEAVGAPEARLGRHGGERLWKRQGRSRQGLER